ncbi:MAG: ATP synthase subunit I [Mycobacterium sp.]|nr:ATP synthase subunit I [Mycobacterium sp.]
MTTPAQEAPFVLPAVAFRPVRLGIICLVLAGLAAGLSAYLDYPYFGLFFAIGLAMGLGNALLIRRAVTNITAKDHPLKSQMAVNSAVRLLVMSVVGLAIAYKWAPVGGLGTLFGIALFEALLVATTSLPVLKKLRAGAAEDAATAANDG